MMFVTLGGSDQRAFADSTATLDFIPSKYQSGVGLLGVPSTVRKTLSLLNAVELPSFSFSLETTDIELVEWLWKSPPFRSKADVFEVRGGEVLNLFSGSVMEIKMTLESLEFLVEA